MFQIALALCIHLSIYLGTCFLHGTDYWGNDIKKINNIGDAQACQIECQKEIQCTYFSYNTASRVCYLKNGANAKSGPDQAKMISGRRNCKVSKKCT